MGSFWELCYLWQHIHGNHQHSECYQEGNLQLDCIFFVQRHLTLWKIAI